MPGRSMSHCLERVAAPGVTQELLQAGFAKRTHLRPKGLCPKTLCARSVDTGGTASKRAIDRGGVDETNPIGLAPVNSRRGGVVSVKAAA